MGWFRVSERDAPLQHLCVIVFWCIEQKNMMQYYMQWSRSEQVQCIPVWVCGA